MENDLISDFPIKRNADIIFFKKFHLVFVAITFLSSLIFFAILASQNNKILNRIDTYMDCSKTDFSPSINYSTKQCLTYNDDLLVINRYQILGEIQIMKDEFQIMKDEIQIMKDEFWNTLQDIYTLSYISKLNEEEILSIIKNHTIN